MVQNLEAPLMRVDEFINETQGRKLSRRTSSSFRKSFRWQPLREIDDKLKKFHNQWNEFVDGGKTDKETKKKCDEIVLKIKEIIEEEVLGNEKYKNRVKGLQTQIESYNNPEPKKRFKISTNPGMNP